ncbi:CbtA family protein [Gordonia sp. X0973]|uniref:CbtA family protein n=1 Tax=Gordonia sp. X0973 TaxID=2742602 RepID=UPI000F53F6D6|nr:CbtA family protein [Gordonia sp. X0973]QKT06750.1 CbtA family protein [Gordonia sp. X0973]
MERRIIGAGLFAGLIAGIVSYVFARIFIEPQVGKAIAYEEGHGAAEEAMNAAMGHGGHDHGDVEVFTRSVQENIGAGVGTVVFGLAMGAFFAVAFVVLWAYIGRRWPSTDPRAVAGVLGLLGFVAAFGVPFFVYPANPPAVGDPDTIGARSGSFLTITLVSVIAMIIAVVVALHLRERLSGLGAAVVSGIGYLVVIGIAKALLPQFHEIPEPLKNDQGTIVYPGFPAEVVGLFRVYVVANQVVLWTVLTLVFAVAISAIARRGARSADDLVAASS